MARVRSLLPLAALVVAATFVVFTGCDIRVFHSPYDENIVIEDTTLLAVVNPTGGASCTPGDLVEIEWIGSVAASAVSIDLYQYGQFLLSICEDAPNAGSFTWVISSDFDTETEVPDEYQIAIRAQHPNHSPGTLYIEAYSEMFSIVPAATGGLSDVTVDDRAISITVTDNGQVIDDDTISIYLNGVLVVSNHVLVAEPGTSFELELLSGSNTLEIYAVNEGTVSPNTAELAISDVAEGEAVQEWRLSAGESGSLVITAP